MNVFVHACSMIRHVTNIYDAMYHTEYRIILYGVTSSPRHATPRHATPRH